MGSSVEQAKKILENTGGMYAPPPQRQQNTHTTTNTNQTPIATSNTASTDVAKQPDTNSPTSSKDGSSNSSRSTSSSDDVSNTSLITDEEKMRQAQAATNEKLKALRAEITEIQHRKLTRDTYFKIYKDDQAYINNPLLSSEADKAKKEAIHAYWSNFERSAWLAYTQAILYGLLQGWGMAGFAQILLKEAELDSEISKAISFVVAFFVATRNNWLVRPDLENLFVFNQLSYDGKPLNRWALSYCFVSALLLGGIVSYGITSSLTHLMDEDDLKVTAPIFLTVTVLLALAEGLLNLRTLDEVFKTGFSKQRSTMYQRYDNDTNKEQNISKASAVYWGTFSMSFLGMIGIALVGARSMSETPAMIAACGILFIATCSQIPFYLDRSKQMVERWVPSEQEKSPIGKPDENSTQSTLIYSKKYKWANTTHWIANAAFNAPAAYVSMSSFFAKCFSLEENHSGSTFEKIFCSYGNSTEAMVSYGAGAAFFFFAFMISLAANFTDPTKSVNPKKEYEMEQKRNNRGPSL